MESISSFHNNRLTVIAYDAECGFCSSFLAWVFEKDERGQFSFASNKGTFSRNAGIDPSAVALIRGDKVVSGGEAVLVILEMLFGRTMLLRAARIVPAWMLNFGYRSFARVRKLVPAPARCRIDTPFRARFLVE